MDVHVHVSDDNHEYDLKWKNIAVALSKTKHVFIKAGSRPSHSTLDSAKTIIKNLVLI